MMYTIQTLHAFKTPQYWNGRGWTSLRAEATEYNQGQRDNSTLPAGGCWTVIDEPEHLGDLFVGNGANSPTRHRFTVIRLRPVSIQLSATEADYEDLNAQALEFEAALRQWVKKQQILNGEWSIDFETDE